MGMRELTFTIVAFSVLLFAGFLVASCAANEEDGFLVEDDIEEASSVSPLPVTASEACCAGGVGPLLNTNYILVSTMDGKVTALDVNLHGRVAWSTDADSPLLSGTLNSLQLVADGHPYMLVPSLDGSLYMFNMDSSSLNPIPVSTDITVMIGEDAVAGGTIVSTTGVDPITGQVALELYALFL